MNQFVREQQLVLEAIGLKLGAISELIVATYHQERWFTVIELTAAAYSDYNSIILDLASPIFLWLEVLLSLQRHLRFCCAFL